MSQWPSPKAKRVLAALLKLGWETRRQTGSHRTLMREGWSDFVFAFHDGYEVAERVTEAGASTATVRPLGLRYPADVFSLSHIAP